MTKYCPFCGEPLIDSAKFCKNCGKNVDEVIQKSATQNQEFQVPTVENSHTAAIVIGYIVAILIPLIGIIISIYLLTRKDSQKANKHGKYMIIVSVVVWFLSFLTIFH